MIRSKVLGGLFLGIFIANPVLAEEAEDKDSESRSRPSFIGITFDRNPNDLKSRSLTADVSVSNKTGLLGEYKSDDLSSDSSTPAAVSAGVGMAYELTDDLSADGKFKFLSIPDVDASGFELGARYWMGAWTFGGVFETTSYRAAGTPAPVGTRRVRASGIRSNGVTLSTAYKFSALWSARISATRYGYGGATPSELANVLATRPNVPVGLLITVEGFPTSSGLLGTTYRPNDFWDLDLAFSRTSYELFPNTTSSALGVSYHLSESWIVGATFISLKQDGSSSGSIVGINASYTWD